MTCNAPGSDGSASEWIKSSYSSNDGPECVEVAVVSGAVHVRDSKVVRGPQLGFEATAWADFVAYASAR
ncbi:DUF397 domain-containing protein [Streptomyces sp. NPDC014735]|uniref:DUF397 domain-containing protein n=1 Tax=unclassified Streptomyces TaxID=2593676 RepID=UPI00093F24E3|nr:DUF397 domain-containing protein [Streptomyces sp. CB01580]OKJ34102.1 toxin [Streptomyces sp. CB01580]